MSFWGGFQKSAEEKLRKEVSTVAIIHECKILIGKRKDNQKWTFPGGHLDPGEDPHSGALRETREEAGLTLSEAKYLGTWKADNGYTVNCFLGKVSDGKTTMRDDPDNEVYRWHWMPIPPKQEVLDNLHVPFESNCLMEAIGLIEKTKGAKKIKTSLAKVAMSSRMAPLYMISDDVARHMVRHRRKDKDEQEKKAYVRGVKPGVMMKATRKNGKSEMKHYPTHRDYFHDFYANRNQGRLR